MKKRTALLVLNLGLSIFMFLSCDWNYSKSPEVPHYEIPEKRPDLDISQTLQYYIITDSNGQKYYYDSYREEIFYLNKNISPSGKALNENDYEIISEDTSFTKKIQKIKAIYFNRDQWRNEQEIKPYWVKEITLKSGRYTDYFNYEGLQDIDVLYRSTQRKYLYANVSCCVFDVDIDKVRSWFDNVTENFEVNESSEIRNFTYGEISDSPYGKVEKLYGSFELFEPHNGKRKINKECFN